MGLSNAQVKRFFGKPSSFPLEFSTRYSQRSTYRFLESLWEFLQEFSTRIFSESLSKVTPRNVSSQEFLIEILGVFNQPSSSRGLRVEIFFGNTRIPPYGEDFRSFSDILLKEVTKILFFTHTYRIVSCTIESPELLKNSWKKYLRNFYQKSRRDDYRNSRNRYFHW